MEYLQGRIDSYNKTKRTKQSLARSTSGNTKWPHAASFIATPRTLADAGFYFDPGPNNLDNVTCFTCSKQLSEWEPDDDPYVLHYQKCGGKCAWASARCGPEVEKSTDGHFHFADSSRIPTSRAMEEARLETFSNWPHDAVKGHGANSRQMAQAGFVYTPGHPGDDSVACYYCGTALNGWDEDDDPIEEHTKRVKRSDRQCAFLNAANSSRPAPKDSTHVNTSKPAPQTVTASSDDELATSIATAYNSKNNASRSMRSSVNRTSMATKTPASGSRRSTRGTGSRTTHSEIDETENGSGSETGKRVSKSKGTRKGTMGTKGKDLMQVVEEEEEPVADGQADDVVEILPPPKPKRGPGRPPKHKKTASVAESEVEVEPAKVPAKKGLARTRSRAALVSDSDVPQPQASGSKRKAGKTKETPIAEPEDEHVQDEPLAKPGRKKAKKGTDSEQASDAAGPSRPKGARARTVSRSKPVRFESDSDVEMLPEAKPPRKVVPAKLVEPKAKAGPSKSKAPPLAKAPETNSSHSDDADDAGYATAEPPAKPRHSREDVPRTSSGSGPQHDVLSKEPEVGNDSDVEMTVPAPLVPKDIAKQATWRSPPQSTSSDIGNRPAAAVRKLSRVSSKSKVSRSSNATNRSARTAIVEISSDEESAVELPKNGRKVVAGGSIVHQSKKAQGEIASLMPSSQTSLVSSSSPPMGPPKGHSKQQNKAPLAGHFRPSTQRGPGSSKSSKGPNLQVVERPRPSINGPGSAKASILLNAAAQDDAADDGLVAVINGKHGAAAARAPSPPANRVVTPIASPPASPPPSTSPEDRPALVEGTEGGFPYLALLSEVPLPRLTTLTEEESTMTVEQWIRRTIDIECQMLREDVKRQISVVKEKAAQIKNVFEAL